MSKHYYQVQCSVHADGWLKQILGVTEAQNFWNDFDTHGKFLLRFMCNYHKQDFYLAPINEHWWMLFKVYQHTTKKGDVIYRVYLDRIERDSERQQEYWDLLESGNSTMKTDGGWTKEKAFPWPHEMEEWNKAQNAPGSVVTVEIDL